MYYLCGQLLALVSSFALDKHRRVFLCCTRVQNMLFAYRSPVAEEHDNHSAYVNDIAVSPFDRSLFATCSSDGTIAVRSTGSVHPAIMYDAIKVL